MGMQETFEVLAASWRDPQFWATAWEVARKNSLYGRQGRKQTEEEWWNRRAQRFAVQTAGQDLSEKVARVMHILGHKNAFRPGTRMLDIGAGTGNYTLPLARRVGEVVALDPAEEMLKILKQRAEEQGITNIKTVCKKWEDIDPEKEGWVGRFDIVLALMTPALKDIENLKKMLRACSRVFLAGGHLRREDPLRRQLWEYLGLGKMPDICPDVFYVFHWLYASGLYPELEMEHYHLKREVSMDEAVAELEDFVFPYLELSPQVEEKIRDFVEKHTRNGVVQMESSFVAAWVVCSLRNGHHHEHGLGQHHRHHC
jgi:ubiquinone/menaquinone biosynthesis C-methylase UbiE